MAGAGDATPEQRLEKLRRLLTGTRRDTRAARSLGRYEKGNVLIGAALHAADRLRQGQTPTDLERQLLAVLRTAMPDWGGGDQWGRWAGLAGLPVHASVPVRRPVVAGPPRSLTRQGPSGPIHAPCPSAPGRRPWPHHRSDHRRDHRHPRTPPPPYPRPARPDRPPPSRRPHGPAAPRRGPRARRVPDPRRLRPSLDRREVLLGMGHARRPGHHPGPAWPRSGDQRRHFRRPGRRLPASDPLRAPAAGRERGGRGPFRRGPGCGCRMMPLSCRAVGRGRWAGGGRRAGRGRSGRCTSGSRGRG